MSALKIGKYELCDWYWSYCFSRNRILDNGKHHIAIEIIKCVNSDDWFVQFYWDFAFLNGLYSGPNYIASPEELKEEINKFLIRVSKMIAFI
jgi:hypothetical protein